MAADGGEAADAWPTSDAYWSAQQDILARLILEWEPPEPEADDDALAHFGLRVVHERDAGRSLAVADGHAFKRGAEVLREAPAAYVLLDEPFSKLERRLVARFNLSKIAPAYRLLARVLEKHGELLADDHIIMSMAANLEVASGQWPTAFLDVLVGAANLDASLRPAGAPAYVLANVTRLFAIIKTNAFGIYDVTAEGIRNVGLGLYLLAGLANHECDPSAVWTFEPTTHRLVLRATRPLAASEPVSISYLLSREPPAARQQKLRESYRFVRARRAEPASGGGCSAQGQAGDVLGGWARW